MWESVFNLMDVAIAILWGILQASCEDTGECFPLLRYLLLARIGSLSLSRLEEPWDQGRCAYWASKVGRPQDLRAMDDCRKNAFGLCSDDWVEFDLSKLLIYTLSASVQKDDSIAQPFCDNLSLS